MTPAENSLTLKRAIQREAQLLRDIATFCEARSQVSHSHAYSEVRDHCLRLAESRKP